MTKGERRAATARLSMRRACRSRGGGGDVAGGGAVLLARGGARWAHSRLVWAAAAARHALPTRPMRNGGLPVGGLGGGRGFGRTTAATARLRGSRPASLARRRRPA